MREQFNAKKQLWISIACLITGVLLLVVVFKKPNNEIPLGDTISKTVYYQFTLRNTTNQPISNAIFYAHAPMKTTGAQRCLSIEPSHAHEIITDKSGRQIIKFSFKNFPPYASKNLSIRATLSLSKLPVNGSENDLLKFTAALPESDPQAALIRDLATTLKSTNTRASASNIFNWVADHIRYTGYCSTAKGASHAFKKRQGDCTEFADLFVALARAANIPARRVSGYLSSGSGVLHPEAYHDWAEFYENGIWRIADPQQRNFDARYTDYIAIQRDDPVLPEGPMQGNHRFYVIGKGLEAKMDS